ncbi:MAG: dihydroorotase [Acidimicrobiales bacterium]
MTVTVITGGTIVGADPTGTGTADRRVADVAVDDDTGLIVAVGAGLSGDRTLDAAGCLVASGLVDLHAHLRQPGREPEETIETGSRAAALGGYPAVVARADTDPTVDHAAVVNEILALAKGALCRIHPAGALTVGRAGEALAPMGELADLGVTVFSDAGRAVQDPAVARRALDYLAGVADTRRLPLVAAQPCVVDALAAGGVMHEGAVSSRLGLAGQPAEAEELAVARDLALARLTGARVHLQGVSTARSVALLRQAKAEGAPVTAETTPHHLVLTDDACAHYDTATKVSPPLRPAADVDAVRAAVIDGTIDAVATGHAPRSPDRTDRPFDQAPFGTIGLETALAVVLGDVGLTPEQALAALSWRPAAIAGLADDHGGPVVAGRAANLVVIDPDHRWRYDPAAGASRSVNSIFAGRELRGRARHTIHRGEPVVVDHRAVR